MARTHILVHRWGPEQGFQRCFADGLDQQLVVSFVCGAGYVSRSLREDYKKHFPLGKRIVIVWFSYFDASNAVTKKSIFLGTVVIKKIENEMVEGQGRERERKTCLFPRPSSIFSWVDLVSAFARLYLLLYVPQKKKHTKKTGTYAGYSTPWSGVSLAINLTAYFSASLLFILRYLPSSEAFTFIHFAVYWRRRDAGCMEESL